MTLGGQSTPILAIAFSPDGKQLALGCETGVMDLYDTTTGTQQQTLKGRPQDYCRGIYLLEFSPDGALLLSGSYWYNQIVEYRYRSHTKDCSI